jgi:hypothetical protein
LNTDLFIEGSVVQDLAAAAIDTSALRVLVSCMRPGKEGYDLLWQSSTSVSTEGTHTLNSHVLKL